MDVSFFLTEVLSPTCAISTFSCEQVKPLIFHPPCCCLVITRSAQCNIAVAIYRISLSLSVIAIYRISLSLAGNELGNVRSRPNHQKQNKWRRHLRSDLSFGSSGQRRTNTRVARTYARWPLRASGLLDPLARTGPPSEKRRRASGQCRGLPEFKPVLQLELT